MVYAVWLRESVLAQNHIRPKCGFMRFMRFEFLNLCVLCSLVLRISLGSKLHKTEVLFYAVHAICSFELVPSMRFGFENQFGSKPHKTEVRFYAVHAVLGFELVWSIRFGLRISLS